MSDIDENPHKEPTDTGEVAAALKVISEAFEADGDEPGSFRYGYVANIAVLLMERHGMTHARANTAADSIVELLFERTY